MKKILASILLASMCLSLIGCGSSDSKSEAAKPDSQVATTTSETEDKTSETENKVSEASTEAGDDTVGTKLMADFKAIVQESPDKTATDIATQLLQNPILDFEGTTMEVQPGLLMGFDNAEITGFSEGVMFSPMIGSIPFVGYIFTVENEDAGKALQQTLQYNANKRWVVCTEADEIVSDVDGNHVFFVMSPKSFEQQ